MNYKFFKKQNGDIIDFIIDERTKVIAKYVNDVKVATLDYEGNYITACKTLCSDEEEVKKLCSI